MDCLWAGIAITILEAEGFRFYAYLAIFQNSSFCGPYVRAGRLFVDSNVRAVRQFGQVGCVFDLSGGADADTIRVGETDARDGLDRRPL